MPIKGRRVRPDLKVKLVFPAQWARPALARQAVKAHRVQRGRLVLIQRCLVRRGTPDHKVRKGYRAYRGRKGRLVRKDRPERRVPQAPCQDRKGRLEIPDQPGQLALQLRLPQVRQIR